MARFSIYVSPEELEWLRLNPPGWLRKTLKLYMAKYPQGVPAEKEK